MKEWEEANENVTELMVAVSKCPSRYLSVPILFSPPSSFFIIIHLFSSPVYSLRFLSLFSLFLLFYISSLPSVRSRACECTLPKHVHFVTTAWFVANQSTCDGSSIYLSIHQLPVE